MFQNLVKRGSYTLDVEAGAEVRQSPQTPAAPPPPTTPHAWTAARSPRTAATSAFRLRPHKERRRC